MKGEEITVVGFKPEKDSNVGLCLQSNSSNKNIIVSEISETSIFANTDLVTGMQILSINGFGCEDMSDDEATSTLALINGNVTLIVKASPPAMPREVTVVVTKEHRDTKVGWTLGTTPGESLYVKQITPDSLFVDTDLEEGMIVRSINGMDLEGSGFGLEQVTKIVASVTGDLTVVAIADGYMAPAPASTPTTMPTPEDTSPSPVTPEISPERMEKTMEREIEIVPESMTQKVPSTSTPVVYPGTESVHEEDLTETSVASVTSTSTGGQTPPPGPRMVAVDKPAGTRAGLNLARTPDQGLIITRVDPNGLFGNKGLQENTRVVSINGVFVRHWEVRDAAKMVSQTTGRLSMVVEPPVHLESATTIANSQRKTIQAQVTRDTLSTRIGLRLKMRRNGSIEIESIAQGSLFARTPLQPGMGLLAINDTPTSGRTHSEVVRQLRTTVGELKLEAM